MRSSTRVAVVAAALLLVVAYLTPLWRIRLVAPQYPEGLGLRIWVNQITGLKPGDLGSINGLNHYIGMQSIEPDAIAELSLMPKLLGAAIVVGLLVALTGRRVPLYIYAVAVAAGSAAGLYDFYRWGWDYGHHLDPHAAIKVPGMSYQPPLIGSRQLLNFHATSWPDLGGWILIAAVAVIVSVAVLELCRALRVRRGAAPSALLAVEPPR